MAKKSTPVQPMSYAVATLIEPPAIPRGLQEAGQRLWTSIQTQYRIEDAGGLAVLQQCCEAADRAERCRRIIDVDGELLPAKDGGPGREHPLLKAEIAAKAFLVRALSRLHLDMEPVRDHGGRPPGCSGA
jgi:hypothetical protein